MGQLATAIHTAAQRIPAAPVADPADLLTGPQLAAIFAQVETAVAALELRAAGSEILSNTGPPDNSAGNDHDLYVDAANGDLWGKDAGAWAFLINLRGPQGIQGPQGDTGPQGIRGLKGNNGTNGTDGNDGTNGNNGNDGRDGTCIRVYVATPALSDGNLDDVAIVSTTGDLLEKTASGWAVRGNVQGPKGDKGDTGATGSGGSGGGTAYILPAATDVLLGGVIPNAADFEVSATGTLKLKRASAAYNVLFTNTAPYINYYLLATTLKRLQKSATIATVSYAINGAAAALVAFDAAGLATTVFPAFPAGARVSWTITLAGAATDGMLFFNETTV